MGPRLFLFLLYAPTFVCCGFNCLWAGLAGAIFAKTEVIRAHSWQALIFFVFLFLSTLIMAIFSVLFSWTIIVPTILLNCIGIFCLVYIFVSIPLAIGAGPICGGSGEFQPKCCLVGPLAAKLADELFTDV